MLLSVLHTLFWGTSSWLWTQELPRSSNEQDQSAYLMAAIAMAMMQRKGGKVEGVKYQSELEQNGPGMRLDDIGMRLTLPFVLASRVSNFLVGFSILLWSAQRLLYRGCLLSVAWTPVCVRWRHVTVSITHSVLLRSVVLWSFEKRVHPSYISNLHSPSLQWRRTVGSNICTNFSLPPKLGHLSMIPHFCIN